MNALKMSVIVLQREWGYHGRDGSPPAFASLGLHSGDAQAYSDCPLRRRLKRYRGSDAGAPMCPLKPGAPPFKWGIYGKKTYILFSRFCRFLGDSPKFIRLSNACWIIIYHTALLMKMTKTHIKPYQASHRRDLSHCDGSWSFRGALVGGRLDPSIRLHWRSFGRKMSYPSPPHTQDGFRGTHSGPLTSHLDGSTLIFLQSTETPY